jgi:rhodanese-related sulfurtransferase
MTGADMIREAEAGRLVLLDVRPGPVYAKGHVAHSMSAPYAPRGWGQAVARWLEGAGRPPVVVLADNAVVGKAAADALRAVGVEPVEVADGGPTTWEAAGMSVVSVPGIPVDRLVQELSAWKVIDVREPHEWRSGIIPGAATVPLNHLPNHLPELSKDAQYALVCQSGNRSQAAAAYMADRGYRVVNVEGGMTRWLLGRHPTDRPR